METTVAAKKITTFRLSEELLERLKVLAKRENRSLNNFVEYTLMEVAYNEPNEETLAAMKEAADQIETLKQIEALVKKEVMEQSQIRGGAVEGFMPD